MFGNSNPNVDQNYQDYIPNEASLFTQMNQSASFYSLFNMNKSSKKSIIDEINFNRKQACQELAQRQKNKLAINQTSQYFNDHFQINKNSLVSQIKIPQIQQQYDQKTYQTPSINIKQNIKSPINNPTQNQLLITKQPIKTTFIHSEIKQQLNNKRFKPIQKKIEKKQEKNSKLDHSFLFKTKDRKNCEQRNFKFNKQFPTDKLKMTKNQVKVDNKVSDEKIQTKNDKTQFKNIRIEKNKNQIKQALHQEKGKQRPSLKTNFIQNLRKSRTLISANKDKSKQNQIQNSFTKSFRETLAQKTKQNSQQKQTSQLSSSVSNLENKSQQLSKSFNISIKRQKLINCETKPQKQVSISKPQTNKLKQQIAKKTQQNEGRKRRIFQFKPRNILSRVNKIQNEQNLIKNEVKEQGQSEPKIEMSISKNQFCLKFITMAESLDKQIKSKKKKILRTREQLRKIAQQLSGTNKFLRQFYKQY